MKQFLFILFTFSAIFASSQEKYISRNGSIQFIASTPLETIDPINNHVSCILDTENGNIVFQLKMISFKFEKALMEEHFNEKYVESEKFPKATFQGKIKDWDTTLLNGEKHMVLAIGNITIHGIKKEIIVNGIIKTNKINIFLSSSFDITLADFGIGIPKLVRDKISKTVKVEVNMNLKLK
jgi:hypothetical protein